MALGKVIILVSFPDDFYKDVSSMVKKVSPLLFLFVVIAASNTACLPVPDKTAREHLAVPIEVPSEPLNPRIHYFFDRTGSMQGFTAKGDASEYVSALPALWQAAEVAFPDFEPHFFEYNEDFTNEFKGSEAIATVKRNVLRAGFYGTSGSSGGNKIQVKRNNNQPFQAAASYIIDNVDNEETQGSLYVVVTDLYEQNIENPFSRFFRDAFSRGLSGAFFAVESSFSGNIYSVSRVNEGENIAVNNGRSTFFICMAGDSAVIERYCTQLSRELSRSRLNSQNVVFMVNPGTIPKPNVGDIELVNSKQHINDNAFSPINLIGTEIDGELEGFEAFRLRGDILSRYSAGFALQNINVSSFDYEVPISLFYDNKKNKLNRLDASTFISAESSAVKDFSAKITPLSNIDDGLVDVNYPMYLTIEVQNKNVKNGWYLIKYSVVPHAKSTPRWVEELNAENIAELRGSVKSERVKVLNLTSVFEKIASAYNDIKSKSIYSNELYLVKR
ncbi:hypothetical protein AGMMS49944_01090 [Spirochaetia bacterium]|nr:hypothetical protein AGMMS49944_01090 [Spirochaetia bacterium]